MGQQNYSYKHLFSHRRIVEDLLRGFVREPWVVQVDFTTLARQGILMHIVSCPRST